MTSFNLYHRGKTSEKIKTAKGLTKEELIKSLSTLVDNNMIVKVKIQKVTT